MRHQLSFVKDPPGVTTYLIAKFYKYLASDSNCIVLANKTNITKRSFFPLRGRQLFKVTWISISGSGKNWAKQGHQWGICNGQVGM